MMPQGMAAAALELTVGSALQALHQLPILIPTPHLMIQASGRERRERRHERRGERR